MECLDTETLCMHLDNELEMPRRAQVALHLQTCQHCTDMLRTLQAQDVRLKSILPAPSLSETYGNPCYSAETLSAYASGVLAAPEMGFLEQHLHTCDVCLREVMAIHSTLRLLQRDPLHAPPAPLVATVQRGFRRADQASQLAQLGTLVIQVARDGLQFIEALLLPEHVRLAIGGHLMPAGAFRSAPSSGEAVTVLDIEQRLGDLDLRLRVVQAEQETVLLRVQLMKQGAPVARQRVSLSAAGRLLYSHRTSSSGEVEFPRLTPGEHTVRMTPENVETHLVLRPAPPRV